MRYSGIVRSELLRLAHLGLPAANDRRQSLMRIYRRGGRSILSHIYPLRCLL
jgi:hypothetical protein